MEPRRKRMLLPHKMYESNNYKNEKAKMYIQKSKLSISEDCLRKCIDSKTSSMSSLSEDWSTSDFDLKPCVSMFTVKVKRPCFNVMDIRGKNFVYQIAYIAGLTQKIRVLFEAENVNSEVKYRGRRWHVDPNLEKFIHGEKFYEYQVLCHPSFLTCLSYTRGQLLLTGCQDGTVTAWNRKFHHVYSFCTGLEMLSDIHASCEYGFYATSSFEAVNSCKADMQYGAALFAFDRTSPLDIFVGHSAGTQCVKFHPGGKYFATASADNTVKLWNINSSETVRTFKHENQWSGDWKKIAFSPDGKYLASTYFGSVKIWDIKSGKLLTTLGTANQKHLQHNVCYSKSGKQVATGGSNKELNVWNVEDNSQRSNELISYPGGDLEINNIWCINDGFCFGNFMTQRRITKLT